MFAPCGIFTNPRFIIKKEIPKIPNGLPINNPMIIPQDKADANTLPKWEAKPV
ncbi:MAG: hypothetical protein PW786_09975 [Arachidicoccus sp.]|nr:hypothetical protein [Arachidicoccus sp.]